MLLPGATAALARAERLNRPAAAWAAFTFIFMVKRLL